MRRSLTQGLFVQAVPRMVAFCGGGGKTTLMYALARELTAQGVPVVCSTTTRMYPPRIPHDVQALLLGADCDLFAAPLDKPGPVLVAERLLPETGKLAGLLPQTLDALALAFPTVTFLVEADGAARKPLKAPLSHEPVFPSSTDTAIALIGLDAVATPLSEDTTHRLDQLCALTGLSCGAYLTSEAIAVLAEHEHGWFQHCPRRARRIVFANKADAFPVPEAFSGWIAGSACEGWCL